MGSATVFTNFTLGWRMPKERRWKGIMGPSRYNALFAASRDPMDDLTNYLNWHWAWLFVSLPSQSRLTKRNWLSPGQVGCFRSRLSVIRPPLITRFPFAHGKTMRVTFASVLPFISKMEVKIGDQVNRACLLHWFRAPPPAPADPRCTFLFIYALAVKAC